jgi:hypothetical protein
MGVNILCTKTLRVWHVARTGVMIANQKGGRYEYNSEHSTIEIV